jgi:probable HAF family extracellular repeat protein
VRAIINRDAKLIRAGVIIYPGATSTSAAGVNNSGQIVGDYMTGGGEPFGFLLNGGAYTPMAVPGSIFTNVTGINNLGQIVGFYGNDGVVNGFCFSDGVYTTINLGYTDDVETGAINDSGAIVGAAVQSNSIVGFEATPVPEPRGLMLTLTGVLALCGILRRAPRADSQRDTLAFPREKQERIRHSVVQMRPWRQPG